MSPNQTFMLSEVLFEWLTCFEFDACIARAVQFHNKMCISIQEGWVFCDNGHIPKWIHAFSFLRTAQK